MNTFNPQDAFNEMRKKTKNSSIFYWILQIITPIAVIGLLISALLPIPPVIFIIVYVISFIFQLCHPSFSYLLNRHHEISIYEKMKSIFSSVPTITFNCVCFHMENIIEKKTDDKGKETETKRTEKGTVMESSFHFRALFLSYALEFLGFRVTGLTVQRVRRWALSWRCSAL